MSGHVGPEELDAALEGCDVVVIPAGVPRKPGMARDDLFNINAGIVKTLVEACAKNCPKAALAIISNPVNSTVPIAAETLKKAGVYDPKRLFGVTTLDVCRANRFVSENLGRNPANVSNPGGANLRVCYRRRRLVTLCVVCSSLSLCLSVSLFPRLPSQVDVTVIGGHAGITIVPLLSRVEGASFSDADRDALTTRIAFGGDEVVKAKDGAGSATLSMAYAGARFTKSLLRAFAGEEGIVECAFVDSGVTDLPFFSTPVELGRDGVKTVHPIGDVSDFEADLIEKMKPELAASIEKGVKFVTG